MRPKVAHFSKRETTEEAWHHCRQFEVVFTIAGIKRSGLTAHSGHPIEYLGTEGAMAVSNIQVL